jgi:hypothetical protein
MIHRVLSIAIALAVAGGAATVVAGRSSGGTRGALSCAELPGRNVPVMRDHRHIPTTHWSHTPYTTQPATSGPHIAFVVEPGVYRASIPDEIAVHDLEHGHVVIRYSPGIGTRDLAALVDLARSYPRDVLLAPYPGLREPIALTAWGRIETLQHADTAQIDAFVHGLRGRYVHGWQAGAGNCL